MGAAQQKLSFLLTGGIIGVWALWKSPIKSKRVWFYIIACALFFFLPRGLWNMQQTADPGLTSFFTTLPANSLDELQGFRENKWWFPVNLFVPDSIGKVSTIIGMQILLVLFIKTKSQKIMEVFFITLSAMIVTYIFGQSIARSFYEFVLWTAIAFSFIPEDKFSFDFFNRLLLLQATVMFVILFFAVWTLVPGVFSQKMRQQVMNRSAWEYSAVSWANEVLPAGSTVISELRSVSLLTHNFIPTDWLNNKKMKDYFLNAIKLKSPNFLISKSKTLNNPVYGGCAGDIFSGPKSFIGATRNPFNSGEEYFVTIYHFHSSLLPFCKK
jgi:hypothetical protein